MRQPCCTGVGSAARRRMLLGPAIAAAAAVVWTGSPVGAAPLDPNSFASLGTLNVSSGTLTINTDTLAISGAASFTGVTHDQETVTQNGVTDWNRHVAVFAFDNVTIGSGVTVNVTGSRPLALLSQGDATISSLINLSGFAGSGTVGGAGGPGGGGVGGTGGTLVGKGGGPGGGSGSSFGEHDGGGGGFGGPGSLGYASSIAGPSYGNLLSRLQAGSGGGGARVSIGLTSGGGGGGGGGGAIEVGAHGSISLAAAVVANGGTGAENYWEGGGGSGGGILVHGQTVSYTGLSAAGGTKAGWYGGEGGGGRVVVLGGPAYTLGTLATPSISVAGATGATAGTVLLEPSMTTIPGWRAVLLDGGPVVEAVGQTGPSDPRLEVVIRRGVTIDSGGVATLGMNNVLKAGSPLIVNGLFNMGGYSQQVGALSGSGQVLVSGTLTVDTGTDDSTFSGLLGSGTGTLQKYGSGTLSLTGSTSYTGQTYVWTGTLEGSTAALRGTIGNYGTTRFNQYTAGTFAGTLTGPGSVEKTGEGTLTIDGTVDAGWLLHVQNGALALGPAGSVTAARMEVDAPGRVRLAAGQRIDVGVSVSSNAGRIELTGNRAYAGGEAEIVFGGQLTNTATGVASVRQGTLRLDGPTVAAQNSGQVQVVEGTLAASGAFHNLAGGQVTARDGFLTFAGGLGNSGLLGLGFGTNDVSGTINNYSGGQIIVSGGGRATFYNSINNTSGAELRVSAGSTAIFWGSVNGTGLITGAGMKYFEGGTSTVASLATTGDTAVAAPAALNASHVRENSLEIAGTVTVAPNGTAAGTSRLNALTITGGGKLDLSDNDLVLDYAGPSPADVVRGYLLAGRNGGGWNGAGGIVTSSGAAESQQRTAVGWAEAGQLGLSSFSGQTVDATSVLLKYTYYGDANLDGAITADDYLRLDRGLAMGLTGWLNGDFDYDGTIGTQDYLLIDRVYLQQAGTVSPDFLAARESQFGPEYVAQLVAAVPEPSATLALAAAALSFTLARRRRRVASGR